MRTLAPSTTRSTTSHSSVVFQCLGLWLWSLAVLFALGAPAPASAQADRAVMAPWQAPGGFHATPVRPPRRIHVAQNLPPAPNYRQSAGVAQAAPNPQGSQQVYGDRVGETAGPANQPVWAATSAAYGSNRWAAPAVEPTPDVAVAAEPVGASLYGAAGGSPGEEHLGQEYAGTCGASCCNVGEACQEPYGWDCGWGGDCCAPECGWFGDPWFGRLWFRGEALVWWGKSASPPPLLTTSPVGTPLADAGVLGLATTEILLGEDGLDPGARGGGRFSFGWWFSPCQVWGMEVTYLFVDPGDGDARWTSDQWPILARPFYDAAIFDNNAVVVAYPDRRTGAFEANFSSNLDTVEVLLRRGNGEGCTGRIDFVFGYRYARLAERLSLASETTFVGTQEPQPQGTLLEAFDEFNTSNEFHGGQIGVVAATGYGRWSLEVLAKLALGGTTSRLLVDGRTLITLPGADPATYAGGMLALPSNMGVYEQTRFSTIPELGVTVGYNLTCRLKATAGYTFLYWSQVARPADQLPTVLNQTQFPPNTLVGYPAPEPRFVLSDSWAQGLSFGLDYRF